MSPVFLKSMSPNATQITIGNKSILFSYETPVALHVMGVGFFKTAERFSKTTSKHVNQWLGDLRNVSTIPQDQLLRMIEAE